MCLFPPLQEAALADAEAESGGGIAEDVARVGTEGAAEVPTWEARMRVGDVGQERNALFLLQERAAERAPRVHDGQEKAVADVRRERALQAEMEVAHAVVLEAGRVVGVVFGRGEERRADAPVEVGIARDVFVVVVIIVVASAPARMRFVVEPNIMEGPRLVAGRDVFEDEAVEPRKARKFQFEPPEAVRPVVKFHAGLVVGKMLVITAQAPIRRFIPQTEVVGNVVRAEDVDLVRQRRVSPAFAPRDDAQEVFEGVRLLADFGVCRRASPLGNVLNANDSREREAAARVFYLEEERLVVPKDVLHPRIIVAVPILKITRVKRTAHAEVAFELQPAFGERDGGKARNANVHFRNGPRVVGINHIAATERGVDQRLVPFLAPEAHFEALIAQFGVQLVNIGVLVSRDGGHHVDARAPAEPFPEMLLVENAGAEVRVVGLERDDAIAVARHPKGRIVARRRTSHDFSPVARGILCNFLLRLERKSEAQRRQRDVFIQCLLHFFCYYIEYGGAKIRIFSVIPTEVEGSLDCAREDAEGVWRPLHYGRGDGNGVRRRENDYM